MIDTSGFTDKDSKRPEYLELYEKHDFITAYAKHTDMRIAKDGPELAIGAKRDGQQDWDIHGQAQLNFLIARGLTHEGFLVDIGCGTGRLACKAIPYLFDGGEYIGVDISASAIEQCANRWNSGASWAHFLHSPTGRVDMPKCPADIVWAHSVVTHLPPAFVDGLMVDVAAMDFGQLFFTYKEASRNQRSGLKQFQYSAQWLIDTAAKYGLKAEKYPHDWPAGQKTMRVTRA